MPAPISPARAAAFHILSKVATSAAHSDDLLHSIAVNALSPDDRNLTTTLVLGVLRWQLYLDTLIKPMMQRPDADIHPASLIALRLGLFQLLYLDRIPAHAALNESVERAKANGAAHAAGMVNAILRRALREKGTENGTARKTLVVKETPAEQAHPQWLITRWKAIYGGIITRRIAEYDQTEPSGHTHFADTHLQTIDDGSRLVAELAAATVTNPKRILDCCAAPGGKTAVLALRHPTAELIASDVNEKRLSAMRKRLDRDPATAHIQTVLTDMTKPELEGKFDLILCDAPCSGTGTLARNPEIRHRLRPSDLPRQAERQRAILTLALELLEPGGRLVYSTCSLEPEENEAIVQHVLTEAPNTAKIPAETALNCITSLTEIEREKLQTTAIHEGNLRTLPGTLPFDGFYATILERSR